MPSEPPYRRTAAALLAEVRRLIPRSRERRRLDDVKPRGGDKTLTLNHQKTSAIEQCRILVEDCPLTRGVLQQYC